MRWIDVRSHRLYRSHLAIHPAGYKAQQTASDILESIDGPVDVCDFN